MRPCKFTLERRTRQPVCVTCHPPRSKHSAARFHADALGEFQRALKPIGVRRSQHPLRCDEGYGTSSLPTRRGVGLAAVVAVMGRRGSCWAMWT
jgi:hypothetical protein